MQHPSVVDVVADVVVVDVVVGQTTGAGASLCSSVLPSLPSCTTVPPYSAQYEFVLRVRTVVTGATPGPRSTAICAPLQMAFASAPFLTRTSLHVAPVESL